MYLLPGHDHPIGESASMMRHSATVPGSFPTNYSRRDCLKKSRLAKLSILPFPPSNGNAICWAFRAVATYQTGSLEAVRFNMQLRLKQMEGGLTRSMVDNRAVARDRCGFRS
jgi:hypothetical protein